MPIGSGRRGGIGVKANPGISGPHKGLPWRSPSLSQSTPSSSHQYDAVYNVLPTGFADSRATVANYFSAWATLSQAAANTARVERSETTGAILGLLVEPAGTNLAPNSETFTQVGAGAPDWHVDAGGSTISASNVVDPRGNKAGFTVNLGTTSANAGGVYINFNALVPGAVHTFSIWLRKSATSGASFVRLSSNDTTQWNVGITTKITLTSEWRRYQLSGVLSTGTFSDRCNVGVDNRDATGTWDSTCTGNVDIALSQLELGSMSSYIRTTSSASVTQGGGRDFVYVRRITNQRTVYV
jgi:hypothetical protein